MVVVINMVVDLSASYHQYCVACSMMDDIRLGDACSMMDGGRLGDACSMMDGGRLGDACSSSGVCMLTGSFIM